MGRMMMQTRPTATSAMTTVRRVFFTVQLYTGKTQGEMTLYSIDKQVYQSICDAANARR